jgi:hypothetical protein
MKYVLLFAALVAVLGLVIWLDARNLRAQLAVQPPAKALHAAQPEVTQPAGVRPATETVSPKLGAEASQTLRFINDRFVASNCTSNAFHICTRNENLSIVEGKLVMAQDFEEIHPDGTVEYSHETTTALVSDLDSDSLKVSDYDFEGASDQIHIGCKGKSECVSAVETSSQKALKSFKKDLFHIGDFARKDANEVESCLRRLLELQQGKPISAAEREPTEEEAAAFIRTHYAPTAELKGITALHRTLTVQRDELVETEDLLQYGSQPGHLVVRVNLKDLDDKVMVTEDSRIGLSCGISGEHIANCFSANTGQSSPDLVIDGVSNPEEFAKMLKRLIVLHK